MAELRLYRIVEFSDNLLRQHLAQLDAPLVEGVNVPDCTLREDDMLVERHELAERCWRELLGEEDVRRAIAFKHPVRHQPIWCALGLDCLGCLAEGQRLSLGEDVCQEYAVVPAERIERLDKGDEVTRDESSALM